MNVSQTTVNIMAVVILVLMFFALIHLIKKHIALRKKYKEQVKRNVELMQRNAAIKKDITEIVELNPATVILTIMKNIIQNTAPKRNNDTDSK